MLPDTAKYTLGGGGGGQNHPWLRSTDINPISTSLAQDHGLPENNGPQC